MTTEVYSFNGTIQDESALQRAGAILRAGGLVAFPTETVYGLGGNGLSPASSEAIYRAKGRPSDNPLILHIAAREELDPLVKEIPPAAERLMEQFWPGPMTLIFQKSDRVPKETTGGLDTVAVRMPSHPIAAAFIRAAGVPVAAPSANRSGRPSPTTAQHVWEDLDGRIEMILDGGACPIGLESTIVDLTGPVPQILRPGYIGQEALEEVLGEVLVDPTVYRPADAAFVPKAPGMKYRHYAPQAALTLFEGEDAAVAEAIVRRAREALQAGQRLRIFCAEETCARYAGLPYVSLGSRKNDADIARRLFGALRQLDEDGIEVAFSECFADGPLGQAIMNRLRKAAGYRIEKTGGADPQEYTDGAAGRPGKDPIMGKREDYINWDEYFMGVAYLSAARSKDPNTQVGACIVSADNKILSMGYNGFPRGCSDEEFPWAREGDPYECKYYYVTHSEMNAILNYRGGSLEGSKLYVTLFPCNECTKALIQAGIRTVIYADDKYADTSWVRAAKRMMNAAGVEFRPYVPTGRKVELNL